MASPPLNELQTARDIHKGFRCGQRTLKPKIVRRLRRFFKQTSIKLRMELIKHTLVFLTSCVRELLPLNLCESGTEACNHAKQRLGLQSADEKRRYAAGKRTTFFLLLMASAPFAVGKKVSSTYFLAQATRSRLQLRSSLCLIFSRWLSIVFTLR